jgi:hypothetical protein
MMKKTIRNQWVAALRSGDYRQIKGNLHQQGGETLDLPAGFCCLGVLCDLAAREGIVAGSLNPRSGIWAYGADTDTGVLPREVLDWAGLKDSDPLVPVGDDAASLTTVNDDYKMTFTEIAHLIEEHL